MSSRAVGVLVAVFGLAAMALATAPASAATLTVDDDGGECPSAAFSTIQAAVDAANPTGDVIDVCAGIYVEQLEVSKELAIDGAGIGATVIYSPASLVTKFTTSGDNKPIVYVHDTDAAVIQGVTVDGAGQGNANDRMVGIAYHQAGGTIQDTRVEDVRNAPVDAADAGTAVLALADDGTPRALDVKDSQFVRFQRSGLVLEGPDLTANVNDNTVVGIGPTPLLAQDGVQLSGGAGGSISGNTISALEFVPHTFCSTAVLLVGPEPGAQISTNTISDTTCGIRAQEGSGTQVSGNSLTGSLLGITLLDNPATVSDNRIAGSAEAGATGISGTESADAGNVTFTVMANTVTGHDGPGAIGVRASDSDTGNLSTVTMDAAFNRITGNTVGAQADETATLNAETNWWGCNDGPDGVDCNDVATMTGGAADFDPWLVMGLTASPSTITAGGATSQVRASLTRNSLGTPVGAGFPDGTGIAFATTLGSIGGSSMTSNGMAASTLTSGGQTGVANVSGTLDNESVFAQVSITPAGTVAADVTAGGKKRKCKKKKYREKHPNKCKKKKGK